MKVIPVSPNQVKVESMGYDVKIHAGANLRVFITKDGENVAVLKVTDKGVIADNPDTLLMEQFELVCPHCGQEPKEGNGNIIVSGKLGYVFSLLLVNDRIHKAVFMCDNCEEMFQLPTSAFIRIVK